MSIVQTAPTRPYLTYHNGALCFVFDIEPLDYWSKMIGTTGVPDEFDFVEDPIWQSMQIWLQEYEKKKNRDDKGRFKKKERNENVRNTPTK